MNRVRSAESLDEHAGGILATVLRHGADVPEIGETRRAGGCFSGFRDPGLPAQLAGWWRREGWFDSPSSTAVSSRAVPVRAR